MSLAARRPNAKSASGRVRQCNAIACEGCLRALKIMTQGMRVTPSSTSSESMRRGRRYWIYRDHAARGTEASNQRAGARVACMRGWRGHAQPECKADSNSHHWAQTRPRKVESTALCRLTYAGKWICFRIGTCTGTALLRRCRSASAWRPKATWPVLNRRVLGMRRVSI